MKTTTIKCLLLVIFAVLPLREAVSQWQFDGVDRVVAIADVHGAFDAMVTTLQNAGVIDADQNWAGGTTHLVICGDILDRGARSRDAMDLIMKLESQAEAAGGKVHMLIGNHEAMNLIGDMRYVAKSELAAYTADETAEERESWLAAYAERKTESGEVTDELRAEFDERFAPGFFAHRRAFASDGKYGKWLLTKPIVVVINGTAFVHGGLSPMIADIGLEGVNGTLQGEMVEYVRNLDILIAAGVILPTDSFYSHPKILDAFMPAVDASAEVIAAADATRKLAESDLHASDGPLWYRGNVACTRVVEEGRLQSVFDRIGAERVVIGHTPTPGRRVLQRFDGDIIEIDTGMLNERYGGSGNALVIDGGELEVINQVNPEVALPLPHPRQVGNRPGGFLSAAETEALLLNGEISNERKDAAGRTIVTVSDGNRTIDAVFAKRASKGVHPELAAYRLDKLIELKMVPVTVRRDLGRSEGTLQFLPPKMSNEQERSESGRGGSAQCPLNEQWSAMYVFDTLIFNEGRTLDRMAYSTDVWRLILVGHDKAFTNSKDRPRHLAQVELDVGQGWRDALEGLTDEVIEQEFADVLNKRRRDALAARRDALLAN